MDKSQTIGELAAALVAFQSDMENVGKDATNPFYKSKYATLENIISSAKPHLKKHGLSFMQLPTGENELTTVIMHKSGEYIGATAKMTPKDSSPQAQGSAITYLRRYALSAALGIATEDDDGNDASHQTRQGMKPYQVARVVPDEDDGETPHTGRRAYPVMDENNDAHGLDEKPLDVKAQKLEIANLLHKGFKFAMVGKKREVIAAKVKELTGLALEEKNYQGIIDSLKKQLAFENA